VKSNIRPRARDDIIRQFRWYLIEQEAPEAANRFLEAVNESIDAIVRMPRMGAPKSVRNPPLRGLRAFPVTGFEEIRIFYLLQGRTVRVLRVLHGKRDVNRILEGEIG